MCFCITQVTSSCARNIVYRGDFRLDFMWIFFISKSGSMCQSLANRHVPSGSYVMLVGKLVQNLLLQNLSDGCMVASCLKLTEWKHCIWIPVSYVTFRKCCAHRTKCLQKHNPTSEPTTTFPTQQPYSRNRNNNQQPQPLSPTLSWSTAWVWIWIYNGYEYGKIHASNGIYHGFPLIAVPATVESTRVRWAHDIVGSHERSRVRNRSWRSADVGMAPGSPQSYASRNSTALGNASSRWHHS